MLVIAGGGGGAGASGDLCCSHGGAGGGYSGMKGLTPGNNSLVKIGFDLLFTGMRKATVH